MRQDGLITQSHLELQCSLYRPCNRWVLLLINSPWPYYFATFPLRGKISLCPEETTMYSKLHPECILLGDRGGPEPTDM